MTISGKTCTIREKTEKEASMLFKRKIYQSLKKWKDESQGKSALLIEGPRRVGKSTIVEEFAKSEYQSYILIDFSTCAPDIRALFEDLSDLNYIFLQLQLQYHVQLHTRQSLIIFDEVQLCPLARQAIKSLVKDHRYDYIETGSLISIKKNVQHILIPSEEHRIYMYPMDYEEFLWAQGDEVTVPLLKQLFTAQKAAGEGAHRKLMRYFRLYMLVGGMPQAVATYLESNNFEQVDRQKREIIELYEDDFRKIDSTGRLSLLFDAIPAQLAKNYNRYHVSNILPSARPADVLTDIAELKDSRTVLVSYHVNDPGPDMAATRDLTRFKLFLADTGLFTTLAFKDKDFTENDIYKKLLSDKLPANLGYLYENIVAQTLAAKGDQLYYTTFHYGETKNAYEIDFLLARQNKICPIEVKSSGYRSHASLDVFCNKYSQFLLAPYVVYTKDLQKEENLTYLPMYMAQFL